MSINNDHLIRLEESIHTHLTHGEKCKSFFDFFEKNNRTEGSEIIKIQNISHFNYLFTHICNRDLEKLEEEYNQISIKITPENIEENRKLNQIKSNILLCKEINSLFCKKIIDTIKSNSSLLLSNESVFFLPGLETFEGGLGECHCSKAMERLARKNFSEELCSEISTAFEKESALSITSIGAGACFHELEIHCLLSKLGYKINYWTLVDPCLNSKTVVNFETILNWETPNTAVIAVNQTAMQYFNGLKNSNDKTQPNVFLFIDVDLHVKLDTLTNFFSNPQQRCCLAEYRKCDSAFEGINIQIINQSSD